MSSFLTCQVKRISVGAGLPNITGQFGSYSTNGIAESDALMAGAFRIDSTNPKSRAFGAVGATSYPITFNASLSNPVYDNSTIVTPLSLSTLPILKY